MSLQPRVSFLDYIFGGCEIAVQVAIDYTASNSSLHSLNANQRNQYTDAIDTVCNVLQEYDSDKLFPVYGFGGRKNGRTSHCFPINGKENAPEVKGADGILQAYKDSLKQIS